MVRIPCCFTSFYSLKLYINNPQINTMHQVLRRILRPIVLSKKESRILRKLPKRHLLTPSRASINEGSTALETNFESRPTLSSRRHIHVNRQTRSESQSTSNIVNNENVKLAELASGVHRLETYNSNRPRCGRTCLRF